MFGKKILILSAHPDDEVVASTGAVLRARTGGADIMVMHLTHGCIPRSDMWRLTRGRYERQVALRRTEAKHVATLLNLKVVGLAERPARYLWRELPDVFAEVQKVVTDMRPDQVWVPAYEGGNPDHDGLNAIGFRLKSRLSVLEFAEYNYFGGEVRPNTFMSTDETTRLIELSPSEQATKRQALGLYKSEKNNLSFIDVLRESYRPLALYDYTLPPHQGTLWYARHQWVPFRHPRVDFTKPHEVSKAMTDFLAQRL